jgi:hypothetical protein
MSDTGFQGFAALHNPSISLADFRTVWQLSEDELCPAASVNLAVLNSPPLQTKYVKTSWLLQSLLEFQDLQEQILTLRTPMPNNSKYFFFEALSALRESALTGSNGSFHASLALLRTFIELMLFHFWWQDRLLRDDKEWTTLISWVKGKWSPPPLKNVMNDVYAGLPLVPGAWGRTELERYYSILCGYVHKPLITQSVTYIRGSNKQLNSPEVLGFWLNLLNAVTRVVLDLMIAKKPQCLFPVPAYRKFGFSPPVGLVFDEFNIVPLQHALGSPTLSSYKSFYQTLPEVEDLLSFFEERPTMSDDEILQSWHDPIPSAERADMSDSDRITLRWLTIKAQMRALQWAFAYSIFDDPSSSPNPEPA